MKRKNQHKYIITAVITAVITAACMFLLIAQPFSKQRSYERDVWSSDYMVSDTVYSVTYKTDTESVSEDLPSVDDLDITYYTTVEDAAKALRKKMVKRKSDITVYYLTAESVPSTLVDDLYDIAVEYTGSGFEGDYLFRHIGTYSSTSETDYPCEVTETEYKEGTLVKLTYSFNWRDTTEQEEAVEKELNKVMPKIIDSGMSDYEKANAIYEWIICSVTYDYDALEALDVIRHTAYDALINRKATCLGYANTFYLMANEAGLRCRVIGTSEHVWNMVEVDNEWYLVDATFGADFYNEGYSTAKCYHWFLRGTSSFSKSHDEPVTTFGVTISSNDYSVSSEDDDESAAATGNDTDKSASTSNESTDNESTTASSEKTDKSVAASDEDTDEKTTTAEVSDEDQEDDTEDAEYIYVYDMVKKTYKIEEIIAEIELKQSLYSFAGSAGPAAEKYPLPFCNILSGRITV